MNFTAFLILVRTDRCIYVEKPAVPKPVRSTRVAEQFLFLVGWSDLPTDPVDLVIDALGPSPLQPSFPPQQKSATGSWTTTAGGKSGGVPGQLPIKVQAAIAWATAKKASIVSLEVPGGVDLLAGRHSGPSIAPTRCVAFGLPKAGKGFAESCDQLYLADSGIPKAAYDVVG